MSNVISELRNTTESSRLYKLRLFLASDVFCALVVAYSFVVICFNWIIPGAFVLAVITGFVFLLSDDIVSVFLPIMLIASFGIQANDSLWDYMALAPFAAFPILAILFHHIFYRERDKSKVKRPGALLLPMILVSITNFLGGIGTIPVKSYFSPTSLIYMFALGFMIVIVYFLNYNHLGAGKNYTDRIDKRIAKIACWLMLFLILATIEGYVERWAKFMEDPGILYFQWRNNASTLFMMSMPFAFYMSARKFWYILLPFASYGAMIMLGSRGGLILGGFELLILIIVDLILDKRHRKYIAAILATIFLAFLFSFPQLEQLLEYTLNRMTAADQYSIRLGLWRRSVEDFHRNPIFGMGLGYGHPPLQGGIPLLVPFLAPAGLGQLRPRRSPDLRLSDVRPLEIPHVEAFHVRVHRDRVLPGAGTHVPREPRHLRHVLPSHHLDGVLHPREIPFPGDPHEARTGTRCRDPVHVLGRRLPAGRGRHSK